MPYLYDPYSGKPLPPPPREYGWMQSAAAASTAAQAQPEQKDPWIMVPTIADVDKVSVDRGETKWIMVQSDQIFAVKTANAMGYAPAEYYRFEQIDPAMLSPAASVPSGQQLTRADVEQIVDAKAQELIGQYLTMKTIQPTAAQPTAKTKKEASQ